MKLTNFVAIVLAFAAVTGLVTSQQAKADLVTYYYTGGPFALTGTSQDIDPNFLPVGNNITGSIVIDETPNQTGTVYFKGVNSSIKSFIFNSGYVTRDANNSFIYPNSSVTLLDGQIVAWNLLTYNDYMSPYTQILLTKDSSGNGYDEIWTFNRGGQFDITLVPGSFSLTPPTSVPLPPSVLLLGSALLGLGALRIRLKRG